MYLPACPSTYADVRGTFSNADDEGGWGERMLNTRAPPLHEGSVLGGNCRRSGG